MQIEELRLKAAQMRADAVTMVHDASTGHTGGDMSAADILTALYYDFLRVYPEDPNREDRDRFFLSKGHSCEIYYSILADKGFFDKSELKTFSQAGSRIIGHPNNQVPGVEVCTGALGHGLPVAVGAAIGARLRGLSYRTVVVMGDGEQAEGSVWEAAMAAANYRLGNLYAVIDRNHLQISGSTEDVMALENLKDKWSAFGWDTEEIDGNDMEKLVAYFDSPKSSDKPHCLIAHTIKGKGLPFAENQAVWHHKVPNDEQLIQAYEALGVKGASFK